jgi:hypothetical protein
MTFRLFNNYRDRKQVGYTLGSRTVYAIMLEGRIVGSSERGGNESPWKEANEGSPVPEEQYQERFWWRRLDGIGLDTVNKEFLANEFKRTRDARSNYVERATAVAQEQYTSLLTGLQAVGQVKGWKAQQIVFVGGTCGSVHVESFNKNMKALGVLESKWDPIRQKLVRRLLEEQDKVLRSYFEQKGGARSQVGEGIHGKGREHVKWDMYA